jgi:hypothetical protein
MAEKKTDNVQTMRRPRGFSPGARGLAGENAHEQGWQINEEERTKTAKSLQGKMGGKDFDYGARDFGDSPVDISSARRQTSAIRHTPDAQPKHSSIRVITNLRERSRH